MAEIRWTKEAILWLQDIHSHISNDSQNIANKVVDGIFEKAQILEDFPKIGYKYENRENIRYCFMGIIVLPIL